LDADGRRSRRSNFRFPTVRGAVWAHSLILQDKGLEGFWQLNVSAIAAKEYLPNGGVYATADKKKLSVGSVCVAEQFVLVDACVQKSHAKEIRLMDKAVKNYTAFGKQCDKDVPMPNLANIPSMVAEEFRFATSGKTILYRFTSGQ